MGESKTTDASRSKSSEERLFNRRTIVPITKFGRVVEALWPDKPALNLAQRMHVTERNALQIINGERRVPARAVVVVNLEMLE